MNHQQSKYPQSYLCLSSFLGYMSTIVGNFPFQMPSQLFLGSPFPMKHAELLVGQFPFSILMVYPMLVNASSNYFI